MFYVIGGEIIFYFAFLNKPLIDNTLIRRITIVVMIICAYLYMIDIIEKTSFSYFIINTEEQPAAAANKVKISR